jgi:hypothetical protein
MCPLPERACVVKGGLCGFCRLGALSFCCICGESPGSVSTDFLSLRSCLAARSAVCCRYDSTCYRVTISSARSIRSFFSVCDRASTRPFVDARGPFITSALGRDPPDTDKISSIVLRDSSPLHNREYAWPEGQVQGTHRAGTEPQGSARQDAADQHRHKSRSVLSHHAVAGSTLQ